MYGLGITRKVTSHHPTRILGDQTGWLSQQLCSADLYLSVDRMRQHDGLVFSSSGTRSHPCLVAFGGMSIHTVVLSRARMRCQNTSLDNHVSKFDPIPAVKPVDVS